MMVTATENQMEQPAKKELGAEVQNFVQEHRRALQITGLVAIAGMAGAAGGLLIAKGLVASKGSTLANLALAAKGATVSNGSVPLATMLTPKPVGLAGTSVLGAAATAATQGGALADKAGGLWNILSTAALPLATGALSGGAVALSATKNGLRQIEQQLVEQRDRANSLHTEAVHLHQALVATTAELQRLQEQQTVPDSPPDNVPDRLPDNTPSVETVVLLLERLEVLDGLSPAVAARLNRAGILNYGDLAARSPEQIGALLDGDERASDEEIAAWISAAKKVLSKE